MRQSYSFLVGVGLFFGWVCHSHAGPLGPDPTLVFEGPVGFSASADTLLNCGGSACNLGGLGDLGLGGAGGLNCAGRNRSSVQISDIPQSDSLVLRHVRINWVASTAANQVFDPEITITPPGGAPIEVRADPELSESFQDGAPAQDCAVVSQLCGQQVACDLGFYSHHADITQAVQNQLQAPGGNASLNGDWQISDVDVPGANGDDPQTAIAAVASLAIGAWSVMIIYSDAENLPTRRVYYYQGFELNSGVDRTLFPTGFRAPPDPAVDMAIMVLEGDNDIPGDQLRVNGRQVSDGCNPVNNIFNSTVNTGTADGRCRQGVTGVDLDRFVIRNAIQPNDVDAEVQLVIPRGDGLLTPGEQLFTNWMVLQFDHLLPDFDAFKPEKEADPPHMSSVQPGQEIQYRIKILNRGDAAALNVVLTDTVPLGTEYVSGSAQLDGMAFPDGPGGTLPLANGLTLTDLAQIGDSIEVDEQHFFEFSVVVNDTAPDGFQISNVARISAEFVDDLRTDPVIHIVNTMGDMNPDPERDQGPPGDDMENNNDELMPIADAGNDGMDAGLRLSHDMQRDAAPPECGEGLRYDPACGIDGDCVPSARPPCSRFCPEPPGTDFVPVECNNGLASTACAEGRTCGRISVEDSRLYACIPEGEEPFPPCAMDSDCRAGSGCHEGICIPLCPVEPEPNSDSASEAGGCDCTVGTDSGFDNGFWFLMLILLWRRPRRWRASHP